MGLLDQPKGHAPGCECEDCFPLADDPADREPLAVIRWREDYLLQAGFELAAARELARSQQVDVHYAEHLTRDLGYSPAQAWLLLSPLE